MAYECVDRYLNTPTKEKLALIWEGVDGQVIKHTFYELSKASNRFANVLKKYGVVKGDRVFVFLERVPQLYIAVGSRGLHMAYLALG